MFINDDRSWSQQVKDSETLTKVSSQLDAVIKALSEIDASDLKIYAAIQKSVAVQFDNKAFTYKERLMSEYLLKQRRAIVLLTRGLMDAHEAMTVSKQAGEQWSEIAYPKKHTEDNS
jgi:hypothetical protein